MEGIPLFQLFFTGRTPHGALSSRTAQVGPATAFADLTITDFAGMVSTTKMESRFHTILSLFFCRK
jgi:hypothetical protein